MPVELKGSCHCGAVVFTVQSSTPVPYQLCLCSICRKVGGTGGSINLGAHAHTLQIIKGKENISIYKAVLSGCGTPEEKRASSERHFCSKCSAMLWLWDETWPELLHPFASAIDEPELKAPEEMTVLMAASAPAYVRLPEGQKKVFKEYPDATLEDWHKERGEYVE
ncbi:Mss4-like protein [Lactarius psammicola]|nr:Mss4-like protein [Lactarius psammicola]